MSIETRDKVAALAAPVAAEPSLRATEFVLHGLAATWPPELDWYRIDPRGNKPGVDAQFTPPVERLAFSTPLPGEFLFPGVYPDAAPPMAHVLRSSVPARSLRGRLPDPTTEESLWPMWHRD